MFTLRKSYTNHFGVDLKSSDLNRPLQYASGMNNAQYRQSGSVEKRKGYQAWGGNNAGTQGGYGMWTYNRVHPSTGAPDTQVVRMEQTLYKLTPATITITYSGTETSVLVNVFVDPATSTYKFQIQDGPTIVLDYDLGVGIDDASPVTLTDLASEINALSDLSATISGDASTPAAFCQITRNWDLVGSGALPLQAGDYTQVNNTVSNPLAAYYAQRATSNFENVSATQLNNVMYFANGFTDMYKYDGQTFYKAGLPTPASVSGGTVITAGNVNGTNYFYRAVYVQYDAAGNIIEGNGRNSAVLSPDPTNEQVDVTVANIQAGSGFNTNGGITFGGAGSPVNTIQLQTGHTFKVGDTAYFLDTNSASYVAREITAVVGDNITIAGAGVTFPSNTVMSNNLRIAIYRTKSSGVPVPGLFYLVAEIPNNSFAATQVYRDNLGDSSLGALYIQPATDRSPPPRGRYVSQWQGLLFVAGDITDRQLLSYSDIDGPEYFPNDRNQLLIDSGAQDGIAGIAPNNEVFYVLGDQSQTIISGDIISGNIRVDTKTRDIGCAAHASIQELDGALVWLSARGPRTSSGGALPRALGKAVDSIDPSTSRIDPEFIDETLVPVQQLVKKRAVAGTDPLTGNYLLYVPAQTERTGGLLVPNENSKVYVYDKSRDAWLIWTNVNAAGGICAFNDNIYFTERRWDNAAAAVKSYGYQRNQIGDAWDYADHVSPVSWNYASQWDPLGEPSILKKYLKLKIFRLEDVPNNEFDVTVDEEVNYQRDVARATFILSIPGGGYGVSPYGTSAYGNPAQAEDTANLNRDRIKSARFVFQNEIIHQNVVLTGWEIECATPYKPEFKP